ncbi:MAG: GNAT family N-acetyltransferase [Oscillospiraceae bacterium]|nr:GNAT family N-acetyltransferase [Oscillospiraceae bacterium]
MTKVDILNIIYEYLAQLMECEVADFTREETTFSVCNVKEPFLKIVICGNSVVVAASPNLYSKAVSLLENKSRDELFECPLIYGQTIHYIPDLSSISDPALPDGFTYSLFQGEDINNLSDITGFDNSLVFDDNGHTNSAIAFVAYRGDAVAAVAGASIAYDNLWEVGIDVLPAFRNQGLATAMVRKLTSEILSKGAVPFYSASITNIGSQMVAARAGYIPCWVDSWGNIFDCFYPYNLETYI